MNLASLARVYLSSVLSGQLPCVAPWMHECGHHVCATKMGGCWCLLYLHKTPIQLDSWILIACVKDSGSYTSGMGWAISNLLLLERGRKITRFTELSSAFCGRQSHCWQKAKLLCWILGAFSHWLCHAGLEGAQESCSAVTEMIIDCRRACWSSVKRFRINSCPLRSGNSRLKVLWHANHHLQTQKRSVGGTYPVHLGCVTNPEHNPKPAKRIESLICERKMLRLRLRLRLNFI